jgi:tRNA (guanine-N7-)-methyltransferase
VLGLSAAFGANIVKRPADSFVFFGRKKGRPLGPQKQAALAQLNALSYGRWTQRWPDEVWLEIGFGFGEHLVQQLHNFPKRHVLGVEVFENGVANACALVGALPEPQKSRCAIINTPAQIVLAELPSQSLAGVYVLFPDPWPKPRQQKRRMISPAFLQSCARLLRPKGQLHFASDHPGLVQHTFRIVQQDPNWIWQYGTQESDPDGWPSLWPHDWPQTRYGQKAYDAGQRAAYGVWQLGST